MQMKAEYSQSLAAVPASVLQRKRGTSLMKGTCRGLRPPIQKKPIGSEKAIRTPPIVHEILRTPGQPLDPETQEFMGTRFGHDFSRVRVHTDAKAAESAKAVNAQAFASGQKIVFGMNQFAPSTSKGRALLAHELAHVIQQTGAGQHSETDTLPGLEKQAIKAADAITTGEMPDISRGAMLNGTLQFAGAETHPTAEQTPDEYIKSHTTVFGLNLQEEKLASDLFLLARQSSAHYDFVLNVFMKLDTDDRKEVAELFFKQVKSDSWFKDMALTQKGRSFLSTIADILDARNYQRMRISEIVASGPQEEVEKERKESIEALKKKGRTIHLTFYTKYKGMDTAEFLFEPISKKREREKTTDAAFPMEEFEDIGAYLDVIARESNAEDFVREIHLLGHGSENKFGFGEYLYTCEYLHNNYKTGQYARFMASGATIYLEGCNVAAGDSGHKYLGEIGRIFLGDGKSGYLKGNTCVIFSIGELTECRPRTLRWPSDFK